MQMVHELQSFFKEKHLFDYTVWKAIEANYDILNKIKDNPHGAYLQNKS